METKLHMEEGPSGQLRRIALGVGAILLPLLVLTFLAGRQIREAAAALRAAELETAQQYARLAAREILYQASQAEAGVLQRLSTESAPALAASLAGAEAALPGIVCFALLEDGEFLYPPDAQQLAALPARAPPEAEPLRTLRIIAAESRALLRRLGTNDLARVDLPSRGAPLAVSMLRLQIEDSAGLIGICWNLQRVRDWHLAAVDQVLPGGYACELTDYEGRLLAGQATGGDELAAVPMTAGAFPWILKLSPVHPADRGLDLGRQVRLHWIMLALLVLFSAAGLWLLVKVTVQAHELGRMKASFASGVSHELRTPLALIQASGEALSERPDMDAGRRGHYLGIIRRESRRLTDLINTVLTFTRLERGPGHFQPAPNDVCGLARAFAEDYRGHAEQQGFTLETQIAGEPLVAGVDALALRLVLINLLDNALKFSQKEKHVRLGVTRRGDSVLISMTDRGIGIAPGDRDRIFEGFYRADTETVRATHGTGIGLALARRIVHAHSGTISVDSRPGEGSTFYIALPLLREGPGTSA